MLAELKEYVIHILNLSVPIQPKTPDEHVSHAWQTSSRNQPQCVLAGPWLIPESANPTGHNIRVKWFHDPTFPMLMDQRCLFVDCEPSEDGSLDLKSVRERWGLSPTCKVIRHRTDKGVKLFVPSSQDRLSRRDIRVMKGQDGCISIVEEPTKADLVPRQYRETWFDREFSFRVARVTSYYHLTQTLVPYILLFLCMALPLLAWPQLDWVPYLALVTGEALVVSFARLLAQWARFTRGAGPPPRFMTQGA